MFWTLVRKDLRANGTALAVWATLLALGAASVAVVAWGEFPGLLYCLFAPLVTVVLACLVLLTREAGLGTEAFLASLPAHRTTRLRASLAVGMTCVLASVIASAVVGTVLLHTYSLRPSGSFGSTQLRSAVGMLVWPGGAVAVWILVLGIAAALRARRAELAAFDWVVAVVALVWGAIALNGLFGVGVVNMLGQPPMDWLSMGELAVAAMGALGAALWCECRVAALDHRKRRRRVLTAWVVVSLGAGLVGLPIQVLSSAPRLRDAARVSHALLSPDASHVVLSTTQRRLAREGGGWVWLCELPQRRWQLVAHGPYPRWWEVGQSLMLCDARPGDHPFGGRYWSFDERRLRPLPLPSAVRQALRKPPRPDLLAVHPRTGYVLARYGGDEGTPPEKQRKLVLFGPRSPAGQLIEGTERLRFLFWAPDGRSVWLGEYPDDYWGEGPEVGGSWAPTVARVVALNLRTGSQIRVAGVAREHHEVKWLASPNGEQLVFSVTGAGENAGCYRGYVLGNDATRPETTPWLPGTPTALAWEAGGRALYVFVHLEAVMPLTSRGLKSPGALVRALHDARDPVSQHLRKQLSTRTLHLLADCEDTSPPPAPLLTALLGALNGRDGSLGLREVSRSADLDLPLAARRLLEQEGGSNTDDRRLDRFVLEAAYPEAIAADPLNPDHEPDRWVILRFRVPSMRQTQLAPFSPRCAGLPVTRQDRIRRGERTMPGDPSLRGSGISHASLSPDGRTLAFVVAHTANRWTGPDGGRRVFGWWQPPSRCFYHYVAGLFTVATHGGAPRELAPLVDGEGEQSAPLWSRSYGGRVGTVLELGWHRSAGIVVVLSDGRVLRVDPESGNTTNLLASSEVTQ
jgi:hypothetical protein